MSVSGKSVGILKRRLPAHIRVLADNSYNRYVGGFNKIPLEELLVEGKATSSSRLKKRLISDGRFVDVCSMCGIGSSWNGAALTLQLDHVNGNSTDNRFENLRILCPICHSQTATHGSKNIIRAVRYCEICKTAKVSRSSRICRTCSGNLSSAKNGRIDIEELVQKSSELGYSATGRLYGISGNAIRKRIRKHEKRKMLPVV